jgi:hypothetical protein
LIPEAALSQSSRFYGVPPQFAHQLRQTTTGTGAAATLGDLKEVKQSLGRHPFDAVIPNLSASAFQAQPPWVSAACKRLGSRLSQ